MSTGAPMLNEELAKSSVSAGFDTTIYRHSNAIRHLQVRFTLIAPSRERLVHASASARIVRRRLILTLKLLMIKVAHFISRIPMLELLLLLCKRGSIVGAICSSKMLRSSGKYLKTSLLVVRHRLIKSRTTQREYELDLKLRACSLELP